MKKIQTDWITYYTLSAWMTSLHLLLTDKPAIAPPVFVFQKDKAQKVSFSMLFKYLFKLKPCIMICRLCLLSLDCILYTLQKIW